MKEVFLGILIALLIVPFAAAEMDHSDFSDIQPLLDNPVDCSSLTEEQLESLGEYFMEFKHPGEAHDQMDAMMGGQGSESLRLMHIQMGAVFYCGEGGPMMSDSGMMGTGGMMPMMGVRSMMGSSGMTPYAAGFSTMDNGGMTNTMDSGMMVSSGMYGYSGLLSVLIGILIAMLAVIVIILSQKKEVI